MNPRWPLAIITAIWLISFSPTVLAADIDGDGVENENDAFPFDTTQSIDSDSDGFGDNTTGKEPDACPATFGTSMFGELGCEDSDGDGRSNLGDAFPTDATQWEDGDGDGFGDNLVGENGDACITEAHSGNHGCAVQEVNRVEEKIQGEVGTSSFNVSLSIAAVLGIILGLKGAIIFAKPEEDDEVPTAVDPSLGGHDDDGDGDDSKGGGSLGILIVALFLLSAIPSNSILLTIDAEHVESSARGEDDPQIWFEEDFTYLAWSDLDDDQLNDVFFVYYEVDTNETEYIEIRAQIDVTILGDVATGVTERTESMTEQIFITNSTGLGVEYEFLVIPWAPGNYSVELLVNIIGDEGGMTVVEYISTDFGGEIVIMDELLIPRTLDIEITGSLTEGETCNLEVWAKDPAEENWSKSGIWNTIWDEGDLIAGDNPEYNCGMLAAGVYYFEFEYTTYFGAYATENFSINIITEAESADYCGGDDRNEMGFCDNFTSPPPDVITPINADVTVAIWVTDSSNGTNTSSDSGPLGYSGVGECQVELEIAEWDNASSVVIAGSPSAGTYAEANLSFDCTAWQVGVHHLRINSTGPNGEWDLAMVTVVIEDTDITSLANAQVVIGDVSSTTFAEALTIMATLSVVITISLALAVGFLHSRINPGAASKKTVARDGMDSLLQQSRAKL